MLSKESIEIAFAPHFLHCIVNDCTLTIHIASCEKLHSTLRPDKAEIADPKDVV
jgi:hypothetical protein